MKGTAGCGCCFLLGALVLLIGFTGFLVGISDFKTGFFSMIIIMIALSIPLIILFISESR